MKLKTLMDYIKTYNHIQLANYDGEVCYPTYASIHRYGEYFVTEIQATDNGLLVISITPNE